MFTEAGILRYSQLDLNDWLAAGYERANTESYLAEVRACSATLGLRPGGQLYNGVRTSTSRGVL